MSGCVSVAGYEKVFPELTEKLREQSPRRYDMGILYILLEEANRGYHATSVEQATQQGTRIVFEAITTQQQKDTCIEKLREYVQGVNNTYGTNLIEVTLL